MFHRSLRCFALFVFSSSRFFCSFYLLTIVLISLYSSSAVAVFRASSSELASVAVLVIVALQNLTVSAINSSENFSIFSYQDVRNWSSWLPMEGSNSILKLFFSIHNELKLNLNTLIPYRPWCKKTRGHLAYTKNGTYNFQIQLQK